MRMRIFPLFALTMGLSFLLSLVLVVQQAGPSYASSQFPEAALPASDRPDGPVQVFPTTHDLAPLAVEIVAPYLPSGLGVGGSVDLTAHTAPPLGVTGVC